MRPVKIIMISCVGLMLVGFDGRVSQEIFQMGLGPSSLRYCATASYSAGVARVGNAPLDISRFRNIGSHKFLAIVAGNIVHCLLSCVEIQTTSAVLLVSSAFSSFLCICQSMSDASQTCPSHFLKAEAVQFIGSAALRTR